MATSPAAVPNLRPDYPYALAFERYREVLAADYARMRELADRARYEVVPYCPDWHGEDVLRHTGTVYLHKVAAMRAGPTDQPPPAMAPEHLGGVDALDLLDDGFAQLSAALDAHDPADRCWTWWPDDQSVGFWIRRMAHETSVHRRDVEHAVGEGTPVAEDLALDGVDEVLELMIEGDWGDDAVDDASESTIEVHTADRVWSVTLGRGSVQVTRKPSTSADGPAATVSAPPSEVLLWLWGRAEMPAVDGDVERAQELRDRLALATR